MKKAGLPNLAFNASRRQFLRNGALVGASLAVTGHSLAASLSGPKRSDMVTIENFSASGKSQGNVQVSRVVKTDTEWRKQLSESAYNVTRHEDTERAFTGEYVNNHEQGVYRCICCDTALFDAATKFESGTGWPSFYQAISKLNVVETSDRSFGMERTAISCSRCDAHLGHLFPDGPKPTGLRYCMNSVALHFVAKA